MIFPIPDQNSEHVADFERGSKTVNIVEKRKPLLRTENPSLSSANAVARKGTRTQKSTRRRSWMAKLTVARRPATESLSSHWPTRNERRSGFSAAKRTCTKPTLNPASIGEICLERPTITSSGKCCIRTRLGIWGASGHPLIPAPSPSDQPASSTVVAALPSRLFGTNKQYRST